MKVRGVGRKSGGGEGHVRRFFNAIPYLGYWDVYKNYFANKQEERGFVVHAGNMDNDFDVVSVIVTTVGSGVANVNITSSAQTVDTDPAGVEAITTCAVTLKWNSGTQEAYGNPTGDVEIDVNGTVFTLEELFSSVVYPTDVSGVGQEYVIQCSGYTGVLGSTDWENQTTTVGNNVEGGLGAPQLTEFNLENIDDMRMDILEAVRDVTAFTVDLNTGAPYGLGLGFVGGDWEEGYKLASQEGLGIKTYQSDLFNNWISWSGS